MEKSSDLQDYLDTLGYAEAPWGEAALYASTGETLANAVLNDALLGSSPSVTAPSRGIGVVQLLFIGEASEDGAPSDRFEGETGELLEKMIAAMGLARGCVEILSIPRPKSSASAESSRAAFEAQFESLKARIDAMQPSVIVSLGQFATQLILKSHQTLPELRGTLRMKDFLKNSSGNEIPVMSTFHPAYLLREPSMKKAAWDDLKQVIKILGGAGA